MSLGLLLLAFLGAVNPCRIRPALPERRAVVALGAVVALAVAGALAAVGGAALDALDVSPESFRLAAALVLAVEGARALVAPRAAAEPELPGLAAALVPVAFPLLLAPAVPVLALAAGGEDAEWRALAALAVALGATLVLPRGRLLAAGARVLGPAAIVAAAALALAAIGDV